MNTITYRCKGYSIKLKTCKHHYITNVCPTYVHSLNFRIDPRKIFTCNEGIVEIDWVTNIIKRKAIKECYNEVNNNKN